MYKKLCEYSFRDLLGKFVLVKNSKFKDYMNDYSLDKFVDDTKKEILKNTFDYYNDKDNLTDLDFINIDNLNEDMSNRKVDDVYEPFYGYFTIDKEYGYVFYFLGNEEDKLKYVYAPTFIEYNNQIINDADIEIIGEIDYQYFDQFLNQIELDEVRNEDILNTRNNKELDIYRIKSNPDQVNCLIKNNNKIYSTKVMLLKELNDFFIARYYNHIGILMKIKDNNSNYLIFYPDKTITEKDSNLYVMDVIKKLKDDYGLDDLNYNDIDEDFIELIRKSFIKGDTISEAINEIAKAISED